MISDFAKSSYLHFSQLNLRNFQTLSMIYIILFSNLRLLEDNLDVSRTRTVLPRLMIPNMDAVGINTITICCFKFMSCFSCSRKKRKKHRNN